MKYGIRLRLTVYAPPHYYEMKGHCTIYRLTRETSAGRRGDTYYGTNYPTLYFIYRLKTLGGTAVLCNMAIFHVP